MKVKLFNETPDSAMDVDMGIFSPGKDDDVMDADDIEFLMTPVSKGRLPQPVILDEDSGLGGDNVTNDNVFLNDDDSERLFAIRRPKQLKPSSARNLSNEFHSKRQVPDNESPFPPAKARREHTPVKRFFSFADAFSKVPDDDDMEEDKLVKTIVNRFEADNDLIADGSSSYCLPTIKGKHSDLKSITPETLADVLRGDYDDVIGTYRIIDCRYPYEYEGGHVQGAENIYEKENALDLLMNQKPATGNDGKRDILIFYCEFSSERGPKMSRFVRSKDREMNSINYPALCYPEVYLLHNGYKNFYEHEKECCEPMNYKPMLHRDHGADLRHFRIRSKTWAAGEKKKQSLRF